MREKSERKFKKNKTKFSEKTSLKNGSLELEEKKSNEPKKTLYDFVTWLLHHKKTEEIKESKHRRENKIKQIAKEIGSVLDKSIKSI